MICGFGLPGFEMRENMSAKQHKIVRRVAQAGGKVDQLCTPPPHLLTVQP